MGKAIVGTVTGGATGVERIYRDRVSGHAGFATIEWVVGALLVLGLAGACATLIRTFTRSVLLASHDAEWEQQAVLASQVLGAELRRGGVGVDWRPYAGDSVRLRAFRGTAWICRATTGARPRVHVVFRGDRTPNPAKDSVVVLAGEVGTRVLALRDRRSRGSCPGIPIAAVEEWDLGPLPPGEALLKLFESGAYSVGGGSLRYRSGRGGRQPVVGSAFDTASSLAALNSPTGVHSVLLTLVRTTSAYRPTVRARQETLYSRRELP